MATDTEFSYSYTETALPTPSDTPHRASSRVSSRPSLHHRDTSPGANYLPVHHGLSRDLDDATTDEETISPLDPRRFTPTLHASLVSEILSLRREVESKVKVIDALENSLDDTRTENESLGDQLSRATKESRSLRHQIQLLEGGTSSALAELAKERDEALENISDVRRKLDQAQKKVRTRDEEAERTQTLWDRDKQTWEGERRNLERKVHIVEGRLKIVLNEVAAVQAAKGTPPSPKDSETASVHSGPNDHHRRRRSSLTSVSSAGAEQPGGVRFSVMSMANDHDAAAAASYDGFNLAQELAFEDEDSDQFDEPSTPDSPGALPEERPTSVHSQVSYTMGMKARKILGLSFDGSIDGSTAGEYVEFSRSSARPRSESWAAALQTTTYRDAGIQYSPPSSPTRSLDSDILEKNSAQTHSAPSVTLTIDMVSTSCQTIGSLPSPPWTPKVVEEPPSPTMPTPAAPVVCMVSSSTQTEQAIARTDQATNTLMQIPMIAIHPPRSEPSSPRDSVVLPPQTKSVACQTNFRSVTEGHSIGIQTEEIRIDKRPVKLPASLLPSAIPDLPTTAVTLLLQDAASSPPPIQPYRPPPPPPPRIPPKSEKRSTSKDLTTIQAYPGNNDNGPLSEDSKSGIRRPFRSSSLFAGFDELTDDEYSPDRDIFTDDDLLNRPFASYTLSRGKLVSTKGRSSLDERPLSGIDEHLFESDLGQDEKSGHPRAGASQQRSGPTSTSKQDIRRAAMISSSAAAHQKTRARSPSEPSVDSSAGSSIAPPFPVPIRLSSRKAPLAGSDGRQSPTPSGSVRNFSERGRQSIVRRPTLRRVRSAAAMSHTETPERARSQSPPSISSYALESPQVVVPPLPFDDITVPRQRTMRASRPTSQVPASYHHRSSFGGHQRSDSTATTVQQTSVVDAIAQTMVGEWMFKYVRRRKSFGVGEKESSWEGKHPDEVSASIGSSGTRHKRWVWLAPYERAVMWSSKQPTSGPALLGKTGRKLIIQSVLDVKDDNPLPKGVININHNGSNNATANAAPFNRSILILTPQRALKFTAMSIERHFVWLTALSFLSHSSIGMHDLSTIPPVPQEEYIAPAPAPSLRRLPIRDSIRVAKGKPRPGPKGKRSFTGKSQATPPLPSLPPPPPPVADMLMDAADPPNVPRFSSHHNHSRKRSNTTPRIPVIRSFSSHATIQSTAAYSSGSGEAASSIAPGTITSTGGGGGGGGHGFSSVRSSFSRRTSEASGRASSSTTGGNCHPAYHHHQQQHHNNNNPNFFDAIGTVRMEAFIGGTNAPPPIPPSLISGPSRSSSSSARPRAGAGQHPASSASSQGRHARKTSSQWSSPRYGYELESPTYAESSEPYFRDEFRGF
ncbi:hypothetical protein ASPZODRAFT_57078 [Penicilliopsis zonata CBS 506.65]|uniref:Pleckstrin homology domain-containing protein n=1 Tax=Penicilliopsis zonata CBS 506.65 TaxID=1073090 RepID=A0A1L9STD5_9EURO|nr:hypothetical protein ASPZODRAFT_57078 [Penicilliopsis zonata CBS 506.65]OJJ50472.1 hypothetical protein ASPZODRAFT_57078 [Penicilliopsis zonata CBS 506.65]